MSEEKLPKGWKNYSLMTLLDVLETGSRPKGGVQGISDGIPSLGGEHIDYNGGFKLNNLKFIPAEFAKKMKRGRIREGDILIVKDGATTGKTSFVDENFPFEEAYVNEHVFICRPDKNSSGKYISYYLRSTEGQSRILENFTGSAQGGINQKFAQNTEIPIAPLPEQQQIVAKLDAVFGYLDRVREKLDRIPELLKNFRQQVLTQAVTGELTREWREGKGLVLANLKLKRKFEIEFELFDYQDLPDSWEYTALGNFVECSRGKFSIRPRNDPRYFDGDYPFIQIGDLPKDGGEVSSFSKTLNNLGKEVSKEFPAGTVVTAIVGATIGNTGILTRNMFFPDSLIGINTKNQISNQFVEYFLRAIKLNLRQLSYAGGGQPNIKLNNIQNLAVALPPFNEQEEIVKRVDALFGLADKIESQYQSLKTKIDHMPQAVLAKAFRGELVSQEVKEYVREVEELGMVAENVVDYKSR